MDRKKWGSLAISLLVIVWLREGLSLIPAFSPQSPVAREKKAYLISVITQFPALEIKNDWTPLIVEGGNQWR